MFAAVLDTNVLRQLTPNRFSELGEAEANAGVCQYADPWTLMELIANLRDKESSDYGPCRKALGRAAKRALFPVDEAPRVLAPSELQVSRLIFGRAPKDQEENMIALVELARSIVAAEALENLADFQDAIDSIAEHVREKEQWFAEYFGGLRQEVLTAAQGETNSERNQAVRKWTRSEEAARLDALAIIQRGYSQAGHSLPDPIPTEIVEKVLAISRPGSAAAGLMLERILCDNVNLDRSRHRNLMWDQEISASVGQTIRGKPVVIVTDDRYFAEAASIAGHPSGVFTLDSYFERLRQQ